MNIMRNRVNPNGSTAAQRASETSHITIPASPSVRSSSKNDSTRGCQGTYGRDRRRRASSASLHRCSVVQVVSTPWSLRVRLVSSPRGVRMTVLVNTDRPSSHRLVAIASGSSRP